MFVQFPFLTIKGVYGLKYTANEAKENRMWHLGGMSWILDNFWKLFRSRDEEKTFSAEKFFTVNSVTSNDYLISEIPEIISKYLFLVLFWQSGVDPSYFLPVVIYYQIRFHIRRVTRFALFPYPPIKQILRYIINNWKSEIFAKLMYF